MAKEALLIIRAIKGIQFNLFYFQQGHLYISGIKYNIGGQFYGYSMYNYIIIWSTLFMPKQLSWSQWREKMNLNKFYPS